MDDSRNRAALRLANAFFQFSRLPWKQSPIAGLRPAELMVLHCIKRKVTSDTPGIKVSEISGLLKVTSPTITQLINSLETKGFVDRGIDKNDRRAVQIRLSSEGETVVNQATDAFLTSFKGLVEYLGEENSSKLTELLSKVFTYFNETIKREY